MGTVRLPVQKAGLRQMGALDSEEQERHLSDSSPGRHASDHQEQER